MTHLDLAKSSVELVMPAINCLFEKTNRQELHIVIMDPRFKPWECPFEDAVLFETSIQSGSPWPKPFDEFARNKARQAWREGRSNLVAQTQHPSSLADSDVPFYGSFVYGNVVVACSGVEQWFDLLISGWIALAFEQQLIHYRHQRQQARGD